MKTTIIVAAAAFSAIAAFSAQAQAPVVVMPSTPVVTPTLAICDACAQVQSVTQEKRKGKGGLMGKIGGAVVGGVIGHQVGGGTGKDIATVGGAVGGAVVGNEIEKRMISRQVWVTKLKMKDGGDRVIEQDAQPAWAAGNVLRSNDGGKTWVKS